MWYTCKWYSIDVVSAGGTQLMWCLQVALNWCGACMWLSIDVVPAGGGQLMWYLQVVLNLCGACRWCSIDVVPTGGGQLMWCLPSVLNNWCGACRWWSIDVVPTGGTQLMWYLQLVVNWRSSCRRWCMWQRTRPKHRRLDTAEAQNMSSSKRVHNIFKYNNMYAWSVCLATFVRHTATMVLVDSASVYVRSQPASISCWATVTASWHLRWVLI